MKKLFLLIIPAMVIVSCTPAELTPEQIAAEKEAVEAQVYAFNNAYEEKDTEKITNFISFNEFVAFGTDAAEIIKSKEEWATRLNDDIVAYESIKYGDMEHLSIQVSPSGEMATSIFQSNISMTVAGNSFTIPFRTITTWVKEGGEWKISQLTASMPSTGNSSEEIIDKMESSAEDTEEAMEDDAV